MIKVKIIIFLLSLLLIGNIVKAQNYQINIWGGVGGPSINYSDFTGEQSDKIGFIGGIGYKHFLSSKIALNIGAEYGLYKSTVLFHKLSNTTQEVDSENDPFDFITNAQSYTEKHTINILNIPITIEYNLPINSKIKLYALGGAKIAFPLSSSYNTSIKNLQTLAYYQQWDLTLHSMPEYGLVNLKNIQYDNKIDTKINMVLTFEAGVNLGKIYFGGFIDYGLTNINKTKKRMNLFDYNPSSNTVNTVNLFETGNISSAKTILGGIKFSVSLFKKSINPKSE